MSKRKETSKDKGNLLEKIIEDLCSSYNSSKITRNFKMKGKSGVEREIDVLIESKYKSFDFKIIIESKNYSKKVDINIVESFKTKLNDISGNLGIIACPLGFTAGAIKSAEMNDIQLYQVFDHKLKNTAQFIPLRYVVPYIKSYQVRVSHAAFGGNFSLPSDISKWRFFIKDKILDKDDLAKHAWNYNLIPKKDGNHTADFEVLKIASSDDLDKFYYMELKLAIIVSSDYYLKLFPASFMKNISSGKGNHRINIDMYSKREDMEKNGWKHFNALDEMEEVAKLHDTSPDMKGLIAVEEYTLD